MAMTALLRLTSLVKQAIDRHGGGWKGLRTVATRSLSVAHALGWRGFLRRALATHAPAPLEMGPSGLLELPAATPIDHVELSVGIMAHVYYPDLIDELATDLARMPLPYTLMVSVVDEQARAIAQARFGGLPGLRELHVRIVPNRGRDIAPLLLSFREEILALDLVCHIHTKKSLYTGHEQSEWRRYLIDALLGSSRRIGWILGTFHALPELGMVYPESYRGVPLWAHTWLGNLEWARQLGSLLGISIEPQAYLDYPAGSMFWARTKALRPLFEFGLRLDSFPSEEGQADGTLQHAIERMLALVVRRQGMLAGILPADHSQKLLTEGEKNWQAYFASPLSEKIAYSAIEARLVSFDLFDTLLLRPFLEPAGARAYLAELVRHRFGLPHFVRWREEAEVSARAAAGGDVALDAIYRSMTHSFGLSQDLADQLRSLELATEQRQLKSRPALLAAARALQAAGGKRLVGISDMYLDTAALRQVLPPEVATLCERLYVSCETGWRKDDSRSWRELPRIEGIEPARWLHVGDNEHADVQLPQAAGFIHPVHVLRPQALLSVVPALRGLRPRQEQRKRWQDQLWLGLVANRLTELGDERPESLRHGLTLAEPDAFGYVVMGPLLLDYTTWLHRTAMATGHRHILFLSREGHLLHRLHQQLKAAVPGILEGVEGTYLLASRRGVATPALRGVDDLAHILASPYTGPLGDLLEARLGERIAAATAARLGGAAMAATVYLPEMKERIVEQLRPLEETLLRFAAEERAAYLRYWNEVAGDGPAMVADIGYAATIQALLARLTGLPLGGAYFATKREAGQVEALGGWALGRFHDAREHSPAPSSVMQHHLLLEAVLTAPAGQFSHFESTPDGQRPVHRPLSASSAKTWPTIERIHAGAMRFVDDACCAAGELSLELALDPALVQEPLRCVGAGEWKLGAWSQALQVEDRFTGRGDVQPLASHRP
jgi:FMN phosphatase YigB (HAD superfamily)